MIKQLEKIIARVISDAVRIDGNAHQDELEQAKQLLEKDWRSIEFHGDILEMNAWPSFQDQFKEELNVNKTYEDLENFIDQFRKDLPDNFTNDLVDACYKIASATAQRNKSELVYLSKIRSIMEK